jgi:hypothetical protein
VQFGADETEPLLQLVAFERVGSWREATLRDAVGDVLHDGQDFGQIDAIVKFEYRYVALGVDGVKVAAVGQPSLADIDADEVEVETGLAQGDVRRQRAGSGTEVKFQFKAAGD